MFVWTIRDALLVLVLGFFFAAWVAFYALDWIQRGVRERRRRKERGE